MKLKPLKATIGSTNIIMTTLGSQPCLSRSIWGRFRAACPSRLPIQEMTAQKKVKIHEGMTKSQE